MNIYRHIYVLKINVILTSRSLFGDMLHDDERVICMLCFCKKSKSCCIDFKLALNFHRTNVQHLTISPTFLDNANIIPNGHMLAGFPKFLKIPIN